MSNSVNSFDRLQTKTRLGLENTMQARPRQERKIVYFCRLCRKYNIKTRLSHLENYHNVSHDTVSKRSNKDILNVVFLPITQNSEDESEELVEKSRRKIYSREHA